MADFVLLYSGGSMPETDEEKARVLKAWDGWYSELGGAIKDGGNPFAPAAKVIGSDGKVGDLSGTPLTGYTILQCGLARRGGRAGEELAGPAGRGQRDRVRGFRRHVAGSRRSRGSIPRPPRPPRCYA